MIGRFVDWTVLLAALIGLAATGWWAVYQGPNNAEALQNKLKQQADTTLLEAGHSWASVIVDGQSAVLTGASPNFEAAEEALSSLGPASLVYGGFTVLRSDILSAQPVSPYIWTAERFPDGTLSLSGHVPAQEISDNLLRKAEEIAPGRVSSDLTVSPGAPRGGWEDVADLGLSQLSLLRHGKVNLEDLNLTVTGEVDGVNSEIVGRVREAVRQVPAPFSGISDIVTGFEWWAILAQDKIELNGSVANDADRQRILDVATASFDGVVHDNMTIEPGNRSAWRDTVIVAFPQFAQFEQGVLSAKSDPAQIMVRGRAYESVVAFLKSDLDKGSLPVDMRVDELTRTVTELEGLDLSDATSLTCQEGFNSVMSANSVLFESGSATIDRASGATLDKVMFVANRCANFRFSILGHTDSTGDRDRNVQLSKARADAVKDYLTNRGILAERVETTGVGPDLPVADNETVAGRAKNRRIEFKLFEEG